MCVCVCVYVYMSLVSKQNADKRLRVIPQIWSNCFSFQGSHAM